MIMCYSSKRKLIQVLKRECIKLVSGALRESSALVFTKVNGEREYDFHFTD